MTGDALPEPGELVERLFPRRRVRLTVEADLDPMPGWGHDAEDWRAFLQRHLDDAVGHYHPTVALAPTATAQVTAARATEADQ